MEKIRNVTQDFSLGAFPGAGRAKQENGAVLHAIALALDPSALDFRP
jgi:hypothetical protein